MKSRAIAFLLALTLTTPALAASAPATVRFGKGFEIESEDGNYLLQIRGYVQPRLLLEFGDEPGGDGLTSAAFRVRRGRIYLQGHVFSPAIGYKLQTDFARSNPLLDFYATFQLADDLALQAGQFKMPFSRQALASSSSLQLVERSIATEFFTEKGSLGPDGVPTVNRDVGVMAVLTPGPFVLSLGAFNGNGLNNSKNDNTDFAYAGRLEWNPLGKVKDKEGAFKVHDEPLFGVAVSGVVNNVEGAGDVLSLGADAAFWSGPLSAQGELFFQRLSDDAAPQSFGWYLQGGWLLLPESGVEVAARYAWLDPDTDLAEDGTHQVTVGPNWYVHGHNLKVQAHYEIDVPEVGEAEHGLFLQTTLAFK